MKAFTFSMQKILEFRKFEEQQAEMELAKANAEVNRIQKQLDAVAVQKIKVLKESEGQSDISLYSQVQQYLIFLKQKQEQFLEEMAEASLIVEEKKTIVREAMQKVKVLEKLRENKLTEWKKESLKQEELVMDDVVTSKFKKNQEK